MGIGLDVPDIARPAPVLSDDPEDPVVEAVGNRVASRSSGLAAGRLQERDPRRRKPETKQPADDGIEHVLRRPAAKPPLRLTAIRHGFTTYRPPGSRYPLDPDVERYIAREQRLGRLLDYAVIVPRLQRLYEWSAEELADPRLLELLLDGTRSTPGRLTSDTYGAPAACRSLAA